MARALDHKPEMTNTRADFYHRIEGDSLAPLWEVLSTLMSPEPKTEAIPHVWHYDHIRGHVLEAGEIITAEEAERRVLVLENPGMPGQSRITETLFAGLQLILPGEVAPAHRHTQSALRLVLDGEGAYTSVNGERVTMRRGDFIITPAWTWHDHGNLGSEPVVWLDGLDIPLVRFLDAGFAERSAAPSQEVARPEGDALARYGANMLPVDEEQRTGEPTRLFIYPYAQTRAALLAIAQGAPDAHLGFKQRFVNPATGESPMPTMGTFAQRLPTGFTTRPYRCTDGTVYVCLEGSGEAEINGRVFGFAERDVFVVPSWQTLTLRARTDSILFSYSDRPVQKALGLWREERL